ncbi:MAG: hypothetical protein QOF85_2210 [Solirubrobacterales bacterium]|jgi:adenylate kinase family enzyme|nr:hypothetical protein [Solirubrobacterales bacterium]
MPSALAAAELDVIASEWEDGLDDYLRALDGRIQDLDEWIQRASESLLTFAIPSGFRRNTMPAGEGQGTTSTARSLFALHEYRRFLLEEGQEVPARVDRELRNGIRQWIFRIANEGVEKICGESENGPNRFTFSHMLIALKFSEDLANELDLGQDFSDVHAELDRAAADMAQQLREEATGRGIVGLKPNDDAAHHFVTLHGVRALDMSDTDVKDATKLCANVSATVLEQLGYHSAKVMARFDPGALVFATALLGRFKAADREQLTEHAVSVARSVQTDDGAWLSEQVVASDGTSRIYVSSYEVGLGLAYLALRELAYGNVGLVRHILPCLEKVMELIRASYISGEAQNDRFKGWANDRSRWPKLIESWATASVLSFMLRYRMVMQGLRQQLVLARYGVTTKKTKDEIGWPDLELAFPAFYDAATREAGYQRIDTHLDKYTDPSEDRQLTSALRGEVLIPVLKEPGNRPEKASFILYGPPGSRKTSLAKKMAQALGWPILVLSPPDFLGEHGLDGFEGAAARIFNDLMRLRRVIVLFDECEDFFKPRRRPKLGKRKIKLQARGGRRNLEERPEARTIGAFLTAGMLPRLQRLRDNRWVIFILATNIEDLNELDEAVRRPGRFDFADELRHPKLEAQRRYIEEHKRADDLKENVSLFQEALEDYADGKDPEVPYAVIDYVIAGVLDDGWPCTPADIAARLTHRMNEVDRPPSLTTPAPNTPRAT